MGTSQSSGGPGSGVKMVPAWVPDPPAGEPMSPEDPALQKAAEEPNGPEAVSAPKGAYHSVSPCSTGAILRGARVVRLAILFFETAVANDMRRGVGHYVRTGYGGSPTAARRMGGTASTAGVLHDALSSIAAGQPSSPGSPLRPCPARGPICPGGNGCGRRSGCGRSMAHKTLRRRVRPFGTRFADLLTRFPDADLLEPRRRTTNVRDREIHRVRRLPSFRPGCWPDDSR